MSPSLTSDHSHDIANTIRLLSAEAIERAQSGHPGAPMGLAEIATQVWHDALRFDPKDLNWSGRDRFVLSCGHASMLLYSLLHLWDTGLTRDDLKAFRQLNSMTPGHPEVGHTPGVEMTTGPLGQGCATSVGLALGAHLFDAAISSASYQSDHPWKRRKTITLCSDGDLMEGISYESASLAGHWGLRDLVWLYDDNRITIDGATSVAFSENVATRFISMGWRVMRVDGHDPAQLRRVLDEALSSTTQPTLLICRTHIGRGSPNKVDTSASHGAPLGAKELAATREALGWTEAPFEIPKTVRKLMKTARAQKVKARKDWDLARDEWAQLYPEANALADRLLTGQLDQDALIETLLEATPAGGATRKLSNATLLRAYQALPELIGGSADLSGSNGLSFSALASFGQPHHHHTLSRQGRKVHFGIREHAMGAITNGLCLQGFKAFCGTFLVFSDYLRPAVRLAALSKIPSAFVLSHDSIFLGEDGPTHQPIEHAWALRMIPNVVDFRPADGLEVAMSWAWMLTEAKGPTALMLTRQGLPALEREDSFNPKEVWRGAYILEPERGEEGPDIVFVGTGSEVSLCVQSAKDLRQKGYAVRVVSMPSVQLYLRQSPRNQERILPSGALIVTVEAGSSYPWRSVAGRHSLNIGIDEFGASAPIRDLQDHFGFTPEAIIQRTYEALHLRASE